MIQEYVKKPAIVEAVQYETPDQPRTSGNIEEMQEWGAKIEPTAIWDPPEHGDIYVWNESHNDYNLVHPGDWIIKGVEGEFYPCEPKIFEQSFRPKIEPAVVGMEISDERSEPSE